MLVAVFLVGCKEHEVIYEYKQTIVNAKAVVKVEGTDKFVLSFTNGESEYCSFGDYNKYKVGDTLCWKREKDFFGMWYVEDCH
jgi:hypothetical protein